MKSEPDTYPSKPHSIPSLTEDAPAVPIPIHPQAILCDQAKLNLIAREIPYCMFRAYEVLQRIVDRADAEAMYSFASCIVYLTAFCARMAHENSQWFAQKIFVAPEGSRPSDPALIASTVGHETVRWVQRLANIWRKHVPQRAAIDIAEGARGLSMIPGLRVTPAMMSLVRACPDMNEWTQRFTVNASNSNKPTRWSELTLIMTLQWCIAPNPTEVMRFCVEQICRDMPGSLQWMAPRKAKRGTKTRTKTANKTSGRGRKSAAVKEEESTAKLSGVVLFSAGETEDGGCTSLLSNEGCDGEETNDYNSTDSLSVIMEESIDGETIQTQETTPMLSPFDRIPTAYDPVLTSPYHNTRPQPPIVISHGVQTPFMPVRGRHGQQQASPATGDAAQGDAAQGDAAQNEAEASPATADAVEGETLQPGTPRIDSAIAVAQLKASHSFKLEVLQSLTATGVKTDTTPTQNAKSDKSALYTHSTEAFTVSSAACKPHTITPNAEARIYCVTHMVLVLSEFGTRPILHQHCSALELDKLGQLLAQWMLLLAQDFPHAHAYNREIVVEIAACLLICKHNGVLFAPKVLKALAATVELLIDDIRTHGDNAMMRNGGPTARTSVFVPIIAATQSRTDSGAMFAQYHTNYLVGMFFQLVLVDAFGGVGRLNYPTTESTNKHCACVVATAAKETCPVGMSIGQHVLYPAKKSLVPDAQLGVLPKPRVLSVEEAANVQLSGLEGPYPAIFAPETPCLCDLCVNDSISVLPRDCAAQLLAQCYQHARSPLLSKLWEDSRKPVDITHELPTMTGNLAENTTIHTDLTAGCVLLAPQQPQTGRYELDFAEMRSRLSLWCDSYDCNDIRQTKLKLMPMNSGARVNLFELEQKYLAGSHFDAREEFMGEGNILKRKRDSKPVSNKRLQT